MGGELRAQENFLCVNDTQAGKKCFTVRYRFVQRIQGAPWPTSNCRG